METSRMFHLMRTTVKSLAHINYARRLKVRDFPKYSYLFLFYLVLSLQSFWRILRGLNSPERMKDGYGNELESAEQIRT